MGNQKSSKEETATAPSGEGAVKGDDEQKQPPHLEIAGLVMDKNASTTAPKGRRIVKATHPPVSSSSSKEPAAAANKSDEEDGDAEKDDDDSFEKIPHHHGITSSALLSDPSIARENQQEHMETLKQKRITQAEHRRQVSRDKMHEQMRNKKSHADGHQTPKANPMSHFRSAFSVESHPEHKRKLRLVEKDEYVEKRSRPNNDDDSDKDKKWKNKQMTTTIVIVAAAAIVVGLALRWTRVRK